MIRNKMKKKFQVGQSSLADIYSDGDIFQSEPSMNEQD